MSLDLERILSQNTLADNQAKSERNFVKIENEVDGFGEQINTLALHLTEVTAQVINITRDLSLTGIQTVTTLAGRKVKSMIALGSVAATKKQSIGICTDGVGFTTYTQPTTGNYAVNQSPSIAPIVSFSDDTTTNRTFGTVQNIQNGSFNINWTQTGTGATGTAVIGFLVTYHD